MPRSKLDSVGEVIVRLLECWGRYYCWRYTAIDPRPTVILSRYRGKRVSICLYVRENYRETSTFFGYENSRGRYEHFPISGFVLCYLYCVNRIHIVFYYLYCIIRKCFYVYYQHISLSLLSSRSVCKFLYISFYTYSWKQAKELNERLGSNTIEFLQMFKYFRQPLCFLIAQGICH